MFFSLFHDHRSFFQYLNEEMSKYGPWMDADMRASLEVLMKAVLNGVIQPPMGVYLNGWTIQLPD